MIQIEFFLLFSLFPNCASSLFFVPAAEASVLSVLFASGASWVEAICILQKDLLRWLIRSGSSLQVSVSGTAACSVCFVASLGTPVLLLWGQSQSVSAVPGMLCWCLAKQICKCYYRLRGIKHLLPHWLHWSTALTWQDLALVAHAAKGELEKKFSGAGCLLFLRAPTSSRGQGDVPLSSIPFRWIANLLPCAPGQPWIVVELQNLCGGSHTMQVSLGTVPPAWGR
ncbi:hypothetical protein EK904_008014 [Melospiza melodia maxima]|nr:hypothetical protein EK904_008014 [Melospiza melodia maxima]